MCGRRGIPRHNTKNVSDGPRKETIGKFQRLAVAQIWPRDQEREPRYKELSLQARVWTFYQCFTKRYTNMRL